MYVKSKDATTNKVVLSENQDLYSETLTASKINLIATDSISNPEKFTVKIRYNHIPCPATVVQTDADRLEVKFDTPQRAIAPGQSLVIYDGDTVMGGGIIE